MKPVFKKMLTLLSLALFFGTLFVPSYLLVKDHRPIPIIQAMAWISFALMVLTGVLSGKSQRCYWQHNGKTTLTTAPPLLGAVLLTFFTGVLLELHIILVKTLGMHVYGTFAVTGILEIFVILLYWDSCVNSEKVK